MLLLVAGTPSDDMVRAAIRQVQQMKKLLQQKNLDLSQLILKRNINEHGENFASSYPRNHSRLHAFNNVDAAVIIHDTTSRVPVEGRIISVCDVFKI